MQKHRLMYVLILLVCGIGIGFTLRTISQEKSLSEGTSEETTSTEILIFSANTIEQHFAAALKHSHDDQQAKASRAIFANLTLDQVTPLAPQVEKFTTEFSQNDESHGGWILCNAFYHRWGTLAPIDALEYIKSHESNWAGLRETIWKAWAQTDPDAAIAAYDPKLEDQYSSELQDAILDALSSVDPAKALRFADVQEIGGYHFTPANRSVMYDRYSVGSDLLEYVSIERPYSTFGLAIYSWIHRDPAAALDEMLKLKYDSLQQESLNFLFSCWLIKDPEVAQLALKKISDRGLRESTTHVAMQAYLLRHPREAFEKIIRIPKYVAYKYPDGTSPDGDPFAERNPVDEAKLIETDMDESHPLPYRYCDTTSTLTHDRLDLISEAAASLAIAEGKKAWDKASAIKDKNIRIASLGGALAGWLLHDLNQAAKFTSNSIADHSFIDPGSVDFPDFAARIVSKNLAENDFKKAAAWVEALPAGPLREAGIKSASDTWLDRAWHRALYDDSNVNGVVEEVFQATQKREYQPVVKWLATLPPSKGRDLAASSLCFRLCDHDDPRSALKWADTIGDPRLRILAFESIAKEISKKKNKAVSFDLNAWSSAHPELAEEMKQELLRQMKEKKDDHQE